MKYMPYLITNDKLNKSLDADYADGFPEAYADQKGVIYVVTNNDYWTGYYRAEDGMPIRTEEEWLEVEGKLHIATRKEIKEAGLWDYVINKDDYSSEEDEIETKLEEYLQIGDELLRNKEHED